MQKHMSLLVMLGYFVSFSLSLTLGCKSAVRPSRVSFGAHAAAEAEPTPIPEDDDPLDFPTEDPVEYPIPSTDPIVVTPPVTDPIVLPPVIDPLVLPPVVVPPVVVPVDPNAKLTIKVSGRQLLVDGKAFTIKGVCYNPVPKGAGELSGTLFSNPTAAHLVALEQDFKLM
ncbi:MAG: hypothetical protein EOP07_23665, partial [Proteobacteria bacterium]